MSVPLKRKLDMSPNVPSWLKWYVHHIGSEVVIMAASVPIPMKVTSSVVRRWVVIREAER